MNKIADESRADPKKYGVAFGVSEDESVVSVYPVMTGEEGVVGVRRYRGKVEKIGFNLGGVFEEHPQLRVNFTRDCKVSREVDANGLPYLLINLQTALKHVGSSKTPATKTEVKKDPNSGDGKHGGGQNGDGKTGDGQSGDAAPGN